MHMSDPGFYLLVFGCCSITGWICLGVGLHTLRYQRRKERREPAHATGRVVGAAKKVHTPYRGRPVVYYVPVVVFTAGEREYRLENENGHREEEKVGVGRRGDVLYDPEDPSHFHLADDDANEAGGKRLMRFGGALIAGAAVLTLVSWWFRLLR